MACDTCPCLLCPMHSFKGPTLADWWLWNSCHHQSRTKATVLQAWFPNSLLDASSYISLGQRWISFPWQKKDFICPLPSSVNGSSIHLDLWTRKHPILCLCHLPNNFKLIMNCLKRSKGQKEKASYRSENLESEKEKHRESRTSLRKI